MRLKLQIPMLVALTLLLVFAPAVQGDLVRTSRDSTIKSDPEGDAQILLRPEIGDEFVLDAGDQTNGYYRVLLPDGTPGWIYRTLVRRFAGTPDSTSSGGGTPSPNPGNVSTAPTGRLQVHVIDVGQGDAVLIRCPEGTHELLIDAGELNRRYPNSSTAFTNYLTANQAVTNPIEVVVSTHPHSDHIGSMAWVLDHFRVGRYVDDEMGSDSGTFSTLATAIVNAQARGTDYWGAQKPNVPNIDFCPRQDVNARVIRFNNFGHDSNPNNNSVIVRVDFLDDSFLFVGDAAGTEEALLVADTAASTLLDTDFLKVGHHASNTSSSTAFLARVTPQVAARSAGHRDVGTNTNHKHPRSEIVQRLLAGAGPRIGAAVAAPAFNSTTRVWDTITLNRAVYLTSAEGTLVFESDGHGITKRQ